MNVVTAIIVAETKAFLGERLGNFDEVLTREIETEFEQQHQKQLLRAFRLDSYI